MPGGAPEHAVAFEPSGYAYAPGVFQYSASVRALPGFEIERVRFARTAEHPNRRAIASRACAAVAVGAPCPREPARFRCEHFVRPAVSGNNDCRHFSADIDGLRAIRSGATPVQGRYTSPHSDPYAAWCRNYMRD
jgi:hypothetical protein